MDDVHEQIKSFIVDDILSGEKPENIATETNLRESGILDSLSTLKLVSFLEKRFHVAFEASDLEGEHFNSIASIEHLVKTKFHIRQ